MRTASPAADRPQGGGTRGRQRNDQSMRVESIILRRHMIKLCSGVGSGLSSQVAVRRGRNVPPPRGCRPSDITAETLRRPTGAGTVVLRAPHGRLDGITSRAEERRRGRDGGRRLGGWWLVVLRLHDGGDGRPPPASPPACPRGSAGAGRPRWLAGQAGTEAETVYGGCCCGGRRSAEFCPPSPKPASNNPFWPRS